MSRIIISQDKQRIWADGRIINWQNVIDISRFKNKLVIVTVSYDYDISIKYETEEDAEADLLAIKTVLIDLDDSVSGVKGVYR